MINLVTLFCYAQVFRRKKNLQSPKSDYQSALQELHAQLNLERNFLCIFFYCFLRRANAALPVFFAYKACQYS